MSKVINSNCNNGVVMYDKEIAGTQFVILVSVLFLRVLLNLFSVGIFVISRI
jgi:hypothetical protein